MASRLSLLVWSSRARPGEAATGQRASARVGGTGPSSQLLLQTHCVTLGQSLPPASHLDMGMRPHCPSGVHTEGR